MIEVAKNERAQLDGQIAMRLREAQMRRDSFPLHSEKWWYWKGKVEAHRTDRGLVFKAWRKAGR